MMFSVGVATRDTQTVSGGLWNRIRLWIQYRFVSLKYIDDTQSGMLLRPKFRWGCTLHILFVMRSKPRK
jgi:hypothetical protein